MKRLQSVQSHLDVLLKDKKFKKLFEKEGQKIRREQIIIALKKTSKKYPELRIGQLLLNATHATDLYYISDEGLMNALWRYSERG